MHFWTIALPTASLLGITILFFASVNWVFLDCQQKSDVVVFVLLFVLLCLICLTLHINLQVCPSRCAGDRICHAFCWNTEYCFIVHVFFIYSSGDRTCPVGFCAHLYLCTAISGWTTCSCHFCESVAIRYQLFSSVQPVTMATIYWSHTMSQVQFLAHLSLNVFNLYI